MIRQQTKSELIIASFVDLLGHKSFQSITIKDITDNCDICKRTFYHYFKDKYDVVVQLYNSVFTKNDFLNLYSYWLVVYQDKQDYCVIWKKILSDPLCCRHIKDAIYDSLYGFLASQKELYHTNYYKNLLIFQSSGAFCLLYDWIMGNCKEPPEEMAKLMLNTFPFEIKSLYIGYRPGIKSYG